MNPWIIALGALALYSFSKKGNGTADPNLPTDPDPRPNVQSGANMDQFDAPVQDNQVQTDRPMNGNGLDMRFPLRLSTFGW